MWQDKTSHSKGRQGKTRVEKGDQKKSLANKEIEVNIQNQTLNFISNQLRRVQMFLGIKKLSDSAPTITEHFNPSYQRENNTVPHKHACAVPLCVAVLCYQEILWSRCRPKYEYSCRSIPLH